MAPANNGAKAEPIFPRKYWIDVAVLRTSGRTTSYTEVAMLGDARGIKKQVRDRKILKADMFSSGTDRVTVNRIAPKIIPTTETINLPVLNFL